MQYPSLDNGNGSQNGEVDEFKHEARYVAWWRGGDVVWFLAQAAAGTGVSLTETGDVGRGMTERLRAGAEFRVGWGGE